MALEASIYPDGSGTIGGNAIVNVLASQNITAPGTTFFTVANGNFMGTGGGTIGGNATLNISAVNLTTGTSFADIYNYGGASIGGSANINFNLTGNLTTQSDANFQILNYDDGSGSGGGTIGGGAMINVSAANISSTGGNLVTEINNIGGGIFGSANLNFTLTGDPGVLTTSGDAIFQILNGDIVSGGGTIGSDAMINVAAANISTGGGLDVEIQNTNGGQIGGNATINVSASTISAGSGGLTFAIANQNQSTSPAGGTIIGDATIDFSASNISTSGGGVMDFLIFNDDRGGGTAGGMIGGNATINITTADISSAGYIHILLLNSRFADSTAGGTIGGDARINLTAANISWTDDLQTTISNTAANISGSALINFDASGDLNTPSGRDTVFRIYNNGGGSIGSDAMINVSAANVSLGGPLPIEILNQGGNIGGSASINLTATNLSAGPATLTSVASLQTEIDNSNGGVISGNATIDMNISGTATVTNDATIAIYGSDGAASAAINFTGGSYDAGGTFTAFTDGNGTITFNNASVHADVLKVGALGTNGVLNIGGGTLSADTTLKLYAGGSNGTINFKADVTLGGNSAKILAANTVTIFNNVTVTIGGSTPADVYTTNANYVLTSGGNGSTSGTFAGAGANSPQALSSAPSFDDPPPPATLTTTSSKTATSGTTSTKISSTTLSGSKTTSTKATSATINVSSTAELLSLLDGASVGPDGKATISGSKNKSNSGNSSRINAPGRLNADHGAVDIRRMRDRAIDSRVAGRLL
jgi:hypothetical protein